MRIVVICTNCLTLMQEAFVVRLGGHQAVDLFSNIWLEGDFPDNLPHNFEAIAHTYLLTLVFSQAKVGYRCLLMHLCHPVLFFACCLKLRLKLQGFYVSTDTYRKHTS